MNYENFGLEAHSPEEAIYLFALWSTVKAVERTGFEEFQITEALYRSVYQTVFRGITPIGRGVE
jgi:hypothetical protein